MVDSDSGLIEQAVAEYEALRAGGRHSLVDAIDVPGGRVERCGSLEDAAHWTISYVPYEDRAVLPLAVGERFACYDRFAEIDRLGTEYWDRRVHAPPVALVDGARRHFQPARGRLVVGVVEAPARVVLLVALGTALAVVHVAGKAKTLLYRGRPFGLRELDVDGMIRSRRPPEQRPQPTLRVRPSPSIRAHHLLIAGGVEVDVGDGPSLETVLARGLRHLARHAGAVELPSSRCKRKGKTKIPQVLELFRRVILAGGGIFEGCVGDVLEELQSMCPDFDIDAEVFADVLRLIDLAKTCLIERPTHRIWRLCLDGLLDPRSHRHRRFCEETVGRLSETAANTGSAMVNDETNGEEDERLSPASRGRRPTTRAPTSVTTAPRTTTPPPSTTTPPTTTTTPPTPTTTPPTPTGLEAPTPRAETPTSAPQVDVDAVYANPVLAAVSIHSLLVRIKAGLDAEQDPLARARQEAEIEKLLPGFAASVFHYFLSAWRSERSTTPDVAERVVPQGDPAPAGMHGGQGEPRDDGTSDELLPAREIAVREVEDRSEVLADSGSIEVADAALRSAVAVEKDDDAADAAGDVSGRETEEQPGVNQALSHEDAPEAHTPVDGTHADLRETGAPATPTGSGSDEQMVGAAAVDHVTPSLAAVGPTDADPFEEIGAEGAGATDPGSSREAANPVVLQAEAVAWADADARHSGASSNSTIPKGASSRCGAGPGECTTPRRRPLYVPENSVALHTGGWAAPRPAGDPVPLARLTVSAPDRDSQSTTDDACTVAIATGVLETSQGPRGRPHE